MEEKKTYWFPRRTYGWGWGVPSAWQGWVVLIAYFALIGAGQLWLLPEFGKPTYLVYVALLSVLLVFIAWLKGEPPAWSWGKK